MRGEACRWLTRGPEMAMGSGFGLSDIGDILSNQRHYAKISNIVTTSSPVTADSCVSGAVKDATGSSF